MDGIRPDPLWILALIFWIVLLAKRTEGVVCVDGDMYGYTNGQESSITLSNTDPYYLSGTVWYSTAYGQFDCCGVIKAIDVIVSGDGYLEFEVWSLSSPLTTTATFKAKYRQYVQYNNGAAQTLTIPLDSQMPVRSGDALGWIGELSDTVMWSTDATLSPAPDSGYLWEDLSNWGYYNYTYTFAYHPDSFTTLDNTHTFVNAGGEDRVYGVRAIVHPGHAATFDELPVKIAIYTTSHVVGDLVHTVLYSGVPRLEKDVYLTVQATISPNDGVLTWDATTEQIKVGADLTTAAFGSPYTVTVTLSDGCHPDVVSDVMVYVFDDRPQIPVCTSYNQVAIPPSFIWNQTLSQEVDSGVALTDTRWRIPFAGRIEAVEVCVSSSPLDFEIQIWEISDLNYGELIMQNYATFTVTDTGCPTTKVTFPVASQMKVRPDLVIGWRETSGVGGILYSESKYLPATTDFLWTDLSQGIPYDYDVTGYAFGFEDAGFYNLASQRDFGFRVYIGPGALPVISGLPTYIDLRVGDYVKDDVIASLAYSDANPDDTLTLSFTLDPPTGDFTVNDSTAGNADVLVGAPSLDGLQGNTYVLAVEVSDGCTTSRQNVTIHVYIETTTTETTTMTTTGTTTRTTTGTTTRTTTGTTTRTTTKTTGRTTTEPVASTTVAPTTTVLDEGTTVRLNDVTTNATDVSSNASVGQTSRDPDDPMEFWISPTGWAVIGVCAGLGVMIIGTIAGLGRACCKYFGKNNAVRRLPGNEDMMLNNQIKQADNYYSGKQNLNKLRRNSFTPPNSPSPTPRMLTPRNVDFTMHY